MGSPTFTLRLKERWFAAGSAVMRLIVKVVILATTPSLARRRGLGGVARAMASAG